VPVEPEKLMADKRLTRVALWFVVDGDLKRLTWADGQPLPMLPADGFLCGRGVFADGCSENYGGDGWLVVGMTKHGLLCQTTGGHKPDPTRYPGCQFSRCKLAPSALMHVAAEEMQQWR